MHPVSSVCITCDTSHNLCGPCALDVLGSHSRVALTCRSTPLVHPSQDHAHQHSHRKGSHDSRCSGCGAHCAPLGARASLAAPVHASPQAEALSLSIPPPMQQWEEASLRSPRDWLSSVAPEIVSHVEEAPIFHLLFDKEHKTERRKVEEADVSNPDSWPEIRRTMMQSNPDAVVFVHKLDPDSGAQTAGSDVAEFRSRPGDAKLVPAAGTSVSRQLSLSRSFNARNRTWGLVVLGKSCKHACYILQTSKVFSPAGATTHFSLTKAKCFAPSLHQQMEQAWLV